MRRKTLFYLVLWIVFSPCVLFSETVDEIENPKTSRNAWVSDMAGIIDSGTESELNQTISTIELKTRVEIAVVTVKNCETIVGKERTETDVKDFATTLFNRWGIGKKGEDNGALVLVSIEQRRVEVETGYGMESILPDSLVGSLLDRYAVPQFKKDDYAGGIESVVRQMGNVIFRELQPPPYVFMKMKKEKRGLASNISYGLFLAMLAGAIALAFNPQRLRLLSILSGPLTFLLALSPVFFSGTVSYALLTVSLVALYFSFFRLFEKPLLDRAAQEKLRALSETRTEKEVKAIQKMGGRHTGGFDRLLNLTVWLLSVLFFTFGVYSLLQMQYTDDRIADLVIGLLWFGPLYLMGTLPFYLALEDFKKIVPMLCKRCHEKMRLLSGDEEKKHLQDWQSLEENIGSMEYLVWQCPGCQNVETISEKGKGYEKCPRCSHITSERISTKVIKDSSYTSEGLREVTKKCKYEACGFEKTVKESIPKKVAATASSSGSYHSGSSYRSSGSWSSSYHSSGSFGGGHSGGGGAGRSW